MLWLMEKTFLSMDKRDLRIYDNVEEIATRLSLFQRKLWANCNRFIWTTRAWCWSKSNTTNQQINFSGNLDQAEGATMFFIIEKLKNPF